MRACARHAAPGWAASFIMQYTQLQMTIRSDVRTRAFWAGMVGTLRTESVGGGVWTGYMEESG